MLEYEWGSPSHILLPSSAADDSTSSAANSAAHQHHILGPFSAQAADDSTPTADFPPPHPCFPFNSFQQHYNHHFIDPRAFAGASYPPPQPPGPFMMPSDLDPAGFMMVPKPEPAVVTISEPGRIGLNLGLGGRTYFSAADEDFVSRLYRRSRALDGGPAVANSPRCQAEGCNADLTHAKHYHRRHKVCEFHSKASTVVAAGLTQRFCQQCSRFHLLTEFDNGKRSCRRRLADHNRRRRKSHQPAALQDRRPPQLDNTTQNSSRLENPPRSPSDSGTVSVSSAAVAVSSPFRSIQESRSNGYNSSAASSSVSTSSNSMFY